MALPDAVSHVIAQCAKEKQMAPFRFSQTCCTSPAAMWFWAAAFAVLYGMGLLMRSTWPVFEPYADTLLLAALGAACFINFGRNRTLHCGLTGPLFLVAAIVAALIEAGILGRQRGGSVGCRAGRGRPSVSD
jgi:hypothetical protein